VEKSIEELIDENIAAGLMEVVGEENGERLLKLTKTGERRARRLLINQGADPDDMEQVEGVIRSW
jgi:hypothetical protein